MALKPKVLNFHSNERELEEAKQQQMTIQPHHPCRVLVITSNYESELYFERCEIQLEHPELDFRIQYTEHYKRYHIWLKDLDKLTHVSHYSRSRIQNSLNKPNNMGVLSSRKILAQMDYLTEVYKLCKAENDKLIQAEQEFLVKLHDLNIDWLSEGKAGRIYKGGLMFEFRLEQGYIYEKINVDHLNGRSMLESFLLMSDNKLK